MTRGIFKQRGGGGEEGSCLSRGGGVSGDFVNLKGTQDRCSFGPPSPWQARVPSVMPTYGAWAARLCGRPPAAAGINSPHSQLSCWRG